MKPRVFRWDAANANGIALLQNTAGAANLVINGTMYASVNGGTGYVVFKDYSRVVSLTSANNLSAVSFTITGTLNGSAVSETIAGPNANTVSTTGLFDSIATVSVNGAVTQVSVGIGAVGKTRWFQSDYYLNINSTGVQVSVTGTITYSLVTTYDDVNTTSSPVLITPVVAMTAATTNQSVISSELVRYSCISVTAGTGSLVATFIQQGSPR